MMIMAVIIKKEYKCDYHADAGYKRRICIKKDREACNYCDDEKESKITKEKEGYEKRKNDKKEGKRTKRRVDEKEKEEKRKKKRNKERETKRKGKK